MDRIATDPKSHVSLCLVHAIVRVTQRKKREEWDGDKETQTYSDHGTKLAGKTTADSDTGLDKHFSSTWVHKVIFWYFFTIRTCRETLGLIQASCICVLWAFTRDSSFRFYSDSRHSFVKKSCPPLWQNGTQSGNVYVRWQYKYIQHH